MIADVAEIVSMAMQNRRGPKSFARACTLAHLSHIHFLQGWQLCVEHIPYAHIILYNLWILLSA